MARAYYILKWSAVFLILSCSYAIGGSYTVSTEAELKQALIDAKNSSDVNVTINLGANIVVSDASIFDNLSKPLTIYTNTYELVGIQGSGSIGEGSAGAKLRGDVQIVGKIRGGAGGVPDSKEAGAIGVVHQNGEITIDGEISGGQGGGLYEVKAISMTDASGVGGVGLSTNNSSIVINSTAKVTGGNGGSHDVNYNATGSGGSVYRTGRGGVGVYVEGGVLENNGTITGGTGGIAYNLNTDPDNVFAGAGGTGALLIGGGHINSGTIIGGAGGLGGNIGQTSGHGNGGIGAELSNESVLENKASGTIAGANGRTGGGGSTRNGSSGGVGVTMSDSTLINYGSIKGGNSGSTTSNGGGVGIVGSGNVTVVNGGTITAGTNGDGSRANAIQFTNGNNRLELISGYTITGNVIATSTDTLVLGGDSNGTFNASNIGSSNQFQGFGQFEKSGESVWQLNGNNSSVVTPWTLKGGTLKISSDGSLGDVGGSLAFDGGTLQTTDDIAMSRAVSINGTSGTFQVDPTKTLTLNTAVSGTGKLLKSGDGTLILNAANIYQGGTTINSGTLQIGTAGTAGSVVGDILNNGKLSFNRSDAVTYSGVISGTGTLAQAGSGTVTLVGHNTYTGGTTIQSGTLQLGSGTTSGSIIGNVVNAGTLIFNSGDATAFTGSISGAGNVIHRGKGSTRFTSTSTYSGSTTVESGEFVAGGDNVFSQDSDFIVEEHGTIAVNSYDQTFKSLINSGTVDFGQTAGTTVYVSGNYTTQGGTLHLRSALGGDNSQTDRLVVDGDSIGSGLIKITNVGSSGTLTNKGIKIIDIVGQSNAQFELVPDFTFKGEAAVVGGAYAYMLYKNGLDTPSDGDWYLRSESIYASPLYQPGVPSYETYPSTLHALNTLGTLQQRIGNRRWVSDNDFTPSFQTAELSQEGFWTQLKFSKYSVTPEFSVAQSSYDADTYEVLSGFDMPILELSDITLIGGLHFSYGVGVAKTNLLGDQNFDYADGRISTNSYGLGATLSWYDHNGFYADLQAHARLFSSEIALLSGTSLIDKNQGYGLASSIEIGHKIAINPNWSVTPQAQITHSLISFRPFADRYDAQIRLTDGNRVNARVGLGIDYAARWVDGDGLENRSSFYSVANLTRELSHGSSVNVSGTKLASYDEQTSVGFGIGGNYSWGNGQYVAYGEASVEAGISDINASWNARASVGLEIRF